MKAFRITAILMMAFIGVSCTRDPIYEASTKYRFEFEMDRDVLYCTDAEPELIEVLFYDSDTGRKVYETYMPPEGGYLHAVEPGSYDIAVFSMGSKRTEITYTKDLNLLTAETRTIQSSPSRIVLSPDHVWASVMKGVCIPSLSEADPEFMLKFTMGSLCDSWKVVVTGIEGLQYASSSYLYVSGQTEEILLKDMKREGTCSVRAEGGTSTDTTRLEIPFCTFGMPDEKTVKATLVIEARDGQKHTEEFDITSQVRDEENTRHIISIDFPVELMPPVQGGLDPSSDPWDENREQIDIK